MLETTAAVLSSIILIATAIQAIRYIIETGRLLLAQRKPRLPSKPRRKWRPSRRRLRWWE